MKEKYYLSINDSKVVYGIAILLILAHHSLAFPKRCTVDYILFIVNGYNLEHYIGLFSKLCVGLYAFISGYGFYIAAQKYLTIKDNYRYMWHHLCNFYKKFWLVYIIFVPIGIYLGVDKVSAQNIICSFIGKSNVYNKEWWYIWAYVRMMAFFPFLKYALEKIECRIKNKYGQTVVVLFLIYLLFSYKLFLTIFFIGMLFSKYKLFEKLDACFSGITAIFVSCCIILSSFLTVCFLSYSTFVTAGVCIVPLFIWSSLTIIRYFKLNKIDILLQFFGRYSIYMWLTHTFYLYYYWQNLTLWPKYSLLVYLWLVLISLLTAMLLEKIYDSISNTYKSLTQK